MKLLQTTMFIGLLALTACVCSPETAWSDDLYCQEICGNTTSSGCWGETRSHTADLANQEAVARQRALEEEQAKQHQECYDAGYDVNESYAIIKDYGLTCKKMAYINDHLIDNVEQMDGGYIKGSYSGFLSHGSIEGHSYQYVVTEVLATGKLVKHIQYHEMCDGQKENIKVEYYTESNFVMTYVDECIGNENK